MCGRGTAAVDVTAVLETAFQLSGKSVHLPAGTYLGNTGLTAPICSKITGDGFLKSIIKAGTCVTKLLPIVGSYPSSCEDFQLQGNATANARGLRFTAAFSIEIQ